MSGNRLDMHIPFELFGLVHSHPKIDVLSQHMIVDSYVVCHLFQLMLKLEDTVKYCHKHTVIIDDTVRTGVGPFEISRAINNE